ncbi:MAG: hypothetical protein ACYS4W_07700 [Planctomycetota bacterium]
METKTRPVLSGWPMVFGWLAMIIFAFHASTHMVGAGDTWVAMACGRHFLNHGVDTVEPFSANSHKAGPTEEDIERWPEPGRWLAKTVGLKTVKYWHPTGWVNQNWLTHVIFYWLTHKSPFADAESLSFNTLVYWKFAVYIITVVCVYYTGRLLGVNPALSAAFACFAMFTGRSFFDIRPAGFSNLLVAIFLLVLVLTTYRNVLYIWLIVPLVVFWCNVHGGYVYAFIMLVPFVALNLVTSFSRKWFISTGLRGVCHTIAAGFAAFIAMIIFNPFHLTNLTHTFEISVSKHAEKWRTVNEWHPGFAWSNPVGTGFPFLVLFMLCIGLTLFWLYSRLLRPRFLTAPKNEIEAQKKLFTVMSKVLGYAAAVFGAWVTYIGFSFLNLDPASFFICAIFVGVLLLAVCKNPHFIYLEVPVILLALWATKTQAGHGGTYFYPFVLLPSYVILHILASLFSRNIKIEPINIVFVLATAIAALVLMTVLFNPFKFEQPVWHLEQFMKLRRVWIPRYEGSTKLIYAKLFPVLYVVNIVSVIVWLAVPRLKEFFSRLPGKSEEQPATDESLEPPKLDLAVMVIAALTVYMAYRSRRFIPIAAIAACPVLAMFIEQVTRTIAAARTFHTKGRFAIPPMPSALQLFFTIAGAAAVVGFGTWWGLKFKTVYLDPWPTDYKLGSVFMRMTASDAKPFYALRFIKENNFKGKMFNYWTEGGFIAWGQQPDPNDGKTPLRLFMDGRAQAAYMVKAYDLWSHIMAGGRVAGEIVRAAQLRGRALNSDDYRKIGKWVDQQLKAQKVWVVLMPAGEFDKPFVRGLEHDPNWRIIFINNKQKLFVDITTPEARELFEGLGTGKTVYPDEFSKNLFLAQNLLLYSPNPAERKQGLDYAIAAFEIEPSHAPMSMIRYASRFPQLRHTVTRFCQDYFERFLKEKDQWAKDNGYHHKIVAALNAASYLQQFAGVQKDDKGKAFFGNKIKELTAEQRKVVKAKRW